MKFWDLGLIFSIEMKYMYISQPLDPEELQAWVPNYSSFILEILGERSWMHWLWQ